MLLTTSSVNTGTDSGNIGNGEMVDAHVTYTTPSNNIGGMFLRN